MENGKISQGDAEYSIATLSQEEENYARMSLLLSGISLRAVRALFDKEFAQACLDKTLRGSQKLKKLKLKRIINQSQLNLLFPINGKYEVVLQGVSSKM